MEDKNKSKKAKKVETLVFKSSENGAFSDPFLDFFRHFWWALLQTSSSSSLLLLLLLLRLPCVFTDSLFSSVICLRVDSKPPPTKFLSLSLPPLPACFYPLGFEDSEPKIVDSPKMKMKMSAGKDDGLPDRNSVDSVLKLFGRNIPISISQDLTIPKRGKSSDSREAGEYRPLDAKREEKNLKKPEKIVPCPRCDSYDTKFCYFNNYNVNQPRHFCKNCHRYWTAGGTVRNVPVGASRRRNKHLASQFCHVNATQIEGSDSANHTPTSNVISNTNLLTLGLQKLLPKSMDPPLDEPSTNGSSISTARIEFSKTEGIASSCSRASKQCYLIPPGWDWNSIPAIQWNPPATDAYVLNSTWQCENGNGSGSGILGKHCREMKQGTMETSVLVPKTLRVDDPKEASKSPIWGSLGFKPYSLETKL